MEAVVVTFEQQFYYKRIIGTSETLQWRHNERDGVSNHQRLDCLLSYLFRKHQSSALLALCEGNPPVTGGFPTQRASNAENVSIWWRHHELGFIFYLLPQVAWEQYQPMRKYVIRICNVRSYWLKAYSHDLIKNGPWSFTIHITHTQLSLGFAEKKRTVSWTAHPMMMRELPVHW